MTILVQAFTKILRASWKSETINGVMTLLRNQLTQQSSLLVSHFHF